MATISVLVLAPGVDDGLGVLERVAPVGVQALVAEATVEALDEGVLCRRPGLMKWSFTPRSPAHLSRATEANLRPVVDDDGLRQAVGRGELVEKPGDPLAADPSRRGYRARPG